METPKKGIAVDGSTRGNPGPSEYRGVDLQTGKVVFHQRIGVATNNIAEFIGLGHAVLFAIQAGYDYVYTDSQTALSWLKKKHVNSKLPDSPVTRKSRDYLDRIMDKISDFNIYSDGIDLTVNDKVKVCKWYTSEYGEIPSDFGLKA
jgi:ribonuclease HI